LLAQGRTESLGYSFESVYRLYRFHGRAPAQGEPEDDKHRMQHDP